MLLCPKNGWKILKGRARTQTVGKNASKYIEGHNEIRKLKSYTRWQGSRSSETLVVASTPKTFSQTSNKHQGGVFSVPVLYLLHIDLRPLQKSITGGGLTSSLFGGVGGAFKQIALDLL